MLNRAKSATLLNHNIQQNIYARNRGFVDLSAEFSVAADSFFGPGHHIL